MNLNDDNCQRKITGSLLVVQTIYNLKAPIGYRHIHTWLHIEAGYCLDAPDILPAGSCVSDMVDIPGIYHHEIIKQATIRRE